MLVFYSICPSNQSSFQWNGRIFDICFLNGTNVFFKSRRSTIRSSVYAGRFAATLTTGDSHIPMIIRFADLFTKHYGSERGGELDRLPLL